MNGRDDVFKCCDTSARKEGNSRGMRAPSKAFGEGVRAVSQKDKRAALFVQLQLHQGPMALPLRPRAQSVSHTCSVDTCMPPLLHQVGDRLLKSRMCLKLLGPAPWELSQAQDTRALSNRH